jgi:pyruvoyl-dependent arginine decarboxylase (PvlArgDC)
MVDIIKTAGTGISELAAFYNALKQGGLGIYNLIRINDKYNVIPNCEKVSEKDKLDSSTLMLQTGDRVYAVVEARAEQEKGKQAWVGMGWTYIMNNGQRNGGFLVSAQGNSEQEVKDCLEGKLKVFKEPQENLGDNFFETKGILCKEKPVCAVISAVYFTQPWKVSTYGLDWGG